MKSIFRSRHAFAIERAKQSFRVATRIYDDGRSRLRDYWVRVLTEAERPLGAFTVVVQLLNAAKMRIAPTAGKRSFRI